MIEAPAPESDQSSAAYAIQLETDSRLALSSQLFGETLARLDRSAQNVASNLVRIVAEPVRDTRLLRIAVHSIDPAFAADYANAWAEAIVAMMNANRTGARQVERATPLSVPLVPRRTDEIISALIAGAMIGGVLALLLGSGLALLRGSRA